MIGVLQFMSVDDGSLSDTEIISKTYDAGIDDDIDEVSGGGDDDDGYCDDPEEDGKYKYI